MLCWKKANAKESSSEATGQHAGKTKGVLYREQLTKAPQMPQLFIFNG